MLGPATGEPTARGRLTLRTLGGASLEASGVTLLPQGKPLALVTYLALSPRRSAQREHLLDLLWADLTPEKARHALRQTVWHLRQILGQECLTTNRQGELTLTAPLTADRDGFLEAVDATDLERATTLYQGDFLAGFAVPGGLEFEHWADVERQRLRAAFLRAAEALTRRHLAAGRYREAQLLARRARDAARNNEAAWRLLLETHDAAGDRLGFAMEAASFTGMLASDGREPEPASRLLLARAGGEVEAGDENPRLVPALVGREREFAEMLGAFEAARRRGGRHLHLTARAGLGKTRLLAEVARRLRGQGARVASVRANPGDRTVPYAFVAELARMLGQLPGAVGVSPASAGALVALAPALSGRFTAPADAATGSELLRRRTSALGELLAAVTDEQPVALLLDDLHWADAASCQVIRALLERIEEHPAVAVTAARPAPGLQLTGQSTQVFELQPLEPAQVHELVASLGELPDTDWGRQLPRMLTASAAGSPLLILETLQLALDRGQLALAAGRWASDDPDALAGMLRRGEALGRRIELLEPEVRRLLLTLSAAGTPLSLSDLSTAAGQEIGPAEGTVAVLEQRGLVRGAAERWEPAHDEIAALVQDLASAAERRAAEGGVGRMLARRARNDRAELARAALHLLAADDRVELRQAWLRFVGLSRRAGDERRLRHLAADFLAGQPAEVIDNLIATMGRWNRVRHRLATRSAVVAGGGLAVLMLASAALRHERTPDMLVLLRTAAGSANEQAIRIPLSERGWADGQPLEVKPRRLVPLPSPAKGNMNYAASQDGRTWLIERDLPDTHATFDIFLRDSSGRERRVIDARHDDVHPSWSPDGTRFTFSTSQWSPPEADNYDIAVHDLRTGETRQVTGGRGADRHPHFAPDGLRIAFTRGQDDAPPEFCVTFQSGRTEPDCWSVPDYAVADVLGWLDNYQVLVTASRAGSSHVLRIGVESRNVALLAPHVDRAALSADRRWLGLLEVDRDGGEQVWSVMPTSNPDGRRSISIPGDQAGTRLLFQPVRGRGKAQSLPPPDFIARVEIGSPTDRAPLDLSHNLTLRALSATGGRLPLFGDRRWWSSDSSVLTVNDSGQVRGIREGTATVTVDVSGELRDSLRLTVVRLTDSFVFREEWRGPIEGKWRAFGIPRPRLATLPDGRHAFTNGGDGSYASGAYSLRHWDLGDGLGTEAWMSFPVNRIQWQVGALELRGGLDTLAMAGWDHEGGHMPSRPLDYQKRSCGANYPAGEGRRGKQQIAGTAGPASLAESVDSSLAGGGWVRLRLQLFPDGTCGVALEGRPIWRFRRPLPSDLPFALMLGTASAGTEILHGPIEVWRGVRTDVPWHLLDDPSYLPDLTGVRPHATLPYQQSVAPLAGRRPEPNPAHPAKP